MISFKKRHERKTVFGEYYITNNILNISDEEFYRNQIEMFYDRKHDAELEAAVE